MTDLERWEEVKESDDFKVMGLEVGGVEEEEWRKVIEKTSQYKNGSQMIHDYLFFTIGFHHAATRAIKAVGLCK